MALDYLSIGPCPAEEPCAQVGSENYQSESRKECNAFIQLIRRTLGEEPPGARLSIRSFPHDFGSYLEVVCYFKDGDEASVAYAYKCEAEAPSRWDTLYSGFDRKIPT